MDIDPIQERTSSINKIIKWFRSLFNKKKTPDYEKILSEVSKNAERNYIAYSDFGLSCEKAGKALAQFGKVLSPNQMREICDLKRIEDEEDCTLYADNKAYCIIRKGEPIWLEKDK